MHEPRKAQRRDRVRYMLTSADRAAIEQTGMLPPGRVDALVFALNAQADSARDSAAILDHQGQEHAAAALRGKALAYRDAARMLHQVADGCALHPRSYSAAKAKARAARSPVGSSEASA